MEPQSRNPSRKPIRRRSHTRKISQGSVINMAEARKEIAHALQLHRSSSSSSSTKTTPPIPSYVGQEMREPWMLGNIPYNYTSCTKKPTLIATSYGCYSLVEAMPIPIAEPVWSTTAPSVPPVAPTAGLEAMEFLEWGENEASSYTWWFGFLGALDGKTSLEKTKQQKQHHFVDDNNISKIEKENGTKHGEVDSFVGAGDQNIVSLDEWLMFPATEDGSDEMVIP